MAPEAQGLDRAIAKLRARDIVSEEEEKVFVASVSDVVEIAAGRTIVRAGASLTHSTVLLDGFACRYKDLADGQRQIQEIHVAGDCMDLHGFLLKSLDHHVGALSGVRIALIPHEALREITENHPHLARLLWFATLLDASIQREHVLSVGRRSALARIAHLFCELHLRLQVAGESNGTTYRLPLTQTDIADASGLTAVHVNRMLKKLRDDDLLTFRGGEVVIHDRDRLERAAEFDPAYLHLERRPR
ncbi:Crp/Fnr family transcriptional regulator [Sphingomonas parva]|uniref:Crp/Fnr family transcriptional regulator n=1 Tax=Sphingomonas parva TaxID=2555898 RepID=A0A4Y8ZY42_9SPHN|nr:Crp/Fnr family transcriptional regulator [Sphingomonas parva]TFI59466.1 Crp/Fnr family transcriptional regulator [Sphingomonas parva]